MRLLINVSLYLLWQSAWAFRGPYLSSSSRHRQDVEFENRDGQLFSMSPVQSSSSATPHDVATEISSGYLLGSQHVQDIPVMDFSNVQNHESRAEVALREAKQLYMNNPSLTGGSSHRLVGINDDVVAEVGYEIGDYAPSEAVIQGCASYLRSLAPSGLFKSAESSTHSLDEIIKYKELLSRTYEESGAITSAFAKTFYLGTSLLPPISSQSIWAIYVWCRRTDEIVDAPRDSDDEMLSELSSWEYRLEKLFDEGEVVDVLDLALLDTKIRYPKLSMQPFSDMIRGMLMDIPKLGVERYDNFQELHLYCYRVAGTVGLMSMPIFGVAKGFTEEIAKEPALSLGVALQITNILRDVGEDASQRNRIYLPLSSLQKFNVTESQIFSKTCDDNFRNLMKYEIRRARCYYEKARDGIPMLSPQGRLPVQASLDCYSKILDKIEANDYDCLNQRAYVGKWEKLATIPFSRYRTQEISKTWPLPGDN